MWFSAQKRRFYFGKFDVVPKIKSGAKNPMIRNNNQTILVVNDVEPTRKGIEALLASDGYRVETARAASAASAASAAARCRQPDLMLVSLEGEADDLVKIASRIRRRACLNENIPIVIFCVGELKEGFEVAAGHSIYLAHPDNFNQLRGFISRLLNSYKAARG